MFTPIELIHNTPGMFSLFHTLGQLRNNEKINLGEIIWKNIILIRMCTHNAGEKPFKI